MRPEHVVFPDDSQYRDFDIIVTVTNMPIPWLGCTADVSVEYYGCRVRNCDGDWEWDDDQIATSVGLIVWKLPLGDFQADNVSDQDYADIEQLARDGIDDATWQAAVERGETELTIEWRE